MDVRYILARSRGCLTSEGRDAIAAFIASRRGGDGGYSGKSPASDLYYTFFAAASLDALGKRGTLLSLPRYLESFGDGEGLDFIHLSCLARMWAGFPLHRKLDGLLARMESYRARDGGYHHAIQGSEHGSAYALYIALETYAAARLAPPSPSRFAAVLESLRCSDGGYANEPRGAQGQTNASAAALLTRMRIGLAVEPQCVQFLLSRLDPASGGFFAFPGAPMPDLLSTASSLYALRAAGVDFGKIAPRIRAFVEALWTEEGGFCGTLAESAPDCEYTCYALLLLGAAMPAVQY